MRFGERIRQLRKDNDLTLRELAAQVGIDFTYLSKIENNRGPAPAEATIRRIADVLKAEVFADELILLADKLPTAFEKDLLDRPEEQIAELYRSMAGKRYSEEEWKQIVSLLREKGAMN